MSWLLPRLTMQQAQTRFADLAQHMAGGGFAHDFVAPDLPIAAANPTGGRVAPPALLQEWRDEIVSRVPAAVDATPAGRARLGAETGRALAETVSPIPADAAHDGVWSFLTLALLPDVVALRWGLPEEGELPADRWLGRQALGGGRDRNHLKVSWRRWRVLGPLMLQEPILGEDELVGLFERSSVARNPTLVKVCAQEVLAHSGTSRMEFARSLMKHVSAATGVRLLDTFDEGQLQQLVGTLGSRLSGTRQLDDVPPPPPSDGGQSVLGRPRRAAPAGMASSFNWDSLTLDVRATPVRAAEDEDPNQAQVEPVPAPLDSATDITWTRGELEAVLAMLRQGWPAQVDVIQYALDHDGVLSREELFAVCQFEPTRQLKGFSRPVRRIVTQLAETGEVRAGLPELLTPTYRGGGVADGYRLAQVRG